jgi:lipid II:glycine glycyltransferase (peptidoglycan interpeptide bridge formation enzyme)
MLLWQLLEDARNEGFHSSDFGKTDPDNLGLIHFKKKWGAEEKKLYYHYHPRVPNLVTSNRSGRRYRLFTGLWRRLPFPVLRALNSAAFKQLD